VVTSKRHGGGDDRSTPTGEEREGCGRNTVRTREPGDER